MFCHYYARVIIYDRRTFYKVEHWGTAIAQWNRLRLPSCRPGPSPKDTIYTFIIYSICAIFVI